MKRTTNNPEYTMHKFVRVITVSKIATMHYFEFDKNFKSHGESHNFWEMVYVDSGEVVICAGKKSFPLKQGEIYFHKPNEFHSLSSNKKVPSNIFIVTFDSSSKSMAFFKRKKAVLSAVHKSYIKTLLSEGAATFNLEFNNPQLTKLTLKPNAPFGSQQLIQSTLEQLLIMLIRDENTAQYSNNTISGQKSVNNHLVSAVLDILYSNIYGRITVTEICRKLNYSKTYISKIFSECCNSTIIEYYTKIKINEAKKLIREERYSFSEISDMLGFDNPHYFSRVFKRITNMTPREYTYSTKSDI